MLHVRPVATSPHLHYSPAPAEGPAPAPQQLVSAPAASSEPPAAAQHQHAVPPPQLPAAECGGAETAGGVRQGSADAMLGCLGCVLRVYPVQAHWETHMYVSGGHH